MARNYILISDPEDDEHVWVGSDNELEEVYTASEIASLRDGTVIFKHGQLHCDMRAAARAATMTELMG